MPVERRMNCPICMKMTETPSVSSVTVMHGKCWEQELMRRHTIAPPDSHQRRAIEETLAHVRLFKKGNAL